MKVLILVPIALALGGCVGYGGGAVSYGSGYYGPGYYGPGYGTSVYVTPGTRYYRRDTDRDGIADRYDRDRDGDGVRNRYDRYPGDGTRR